MEPQNIQSQNPQNPTPQISEPRRTNKSLLFILLIPIVAIVAYFLFFYKGSPPQVTGLEVALKTASFLDKTLKPDGSFVSGYLCGDESLPEECVLLSDIPVHTGQAILAYYFLAEVTGDQSFRTKSDLAINYVLDKCDGDIVFCEWNFLPLIQYHQDTGDDKFLSRGLLRPAEKFLAMTNSDVILGQVGLKLAGLFDATRDTRYRNRLLEIADTELQTQSNNMGRDDYNMQLAWSVYMPAYKMTNDPKYLNAVEEFFDKLKVMENLAQFDQANSMVKAAGVLLDLWEITKKETYKVQAHTIMQEVLFNFWDTPQNLKFTGDYGFIDPTDLRLPAGQATKYMLFNGGIIQRFLKLQDDNFEQIKSNK